MNHNRIFRVLLGLVLILAIGCGPAWAADIRNVSALEARSLIQANQDNPDFIILDVRTPYEYNSGHIAGAHLLNYKSAEFPEGLKRLDKTATYLVYCRTGNRSAGALRLMASMGFEKIFHLNAGIMDWSSRKLPLMKQ